MEVLGPSGQSALSSWRVQPPQSTWTRTREELEPIILAEAKALTVAYWQGRLGDARSEAEADNARQKLAELDARDGGGVQVGSATDALTEQEKVLVAMVGERLFPDLSWAEGTIEVEEKLEFGKKIEAFLAANGDALSQRIGNALVSAMNNPSASQGQAQELTAFEWTGQYEHEVEHSFYVSRPLQVPGASLVASHNFIVTNAKFLGDPDATVFSFGHNDSGNLGMVDFCTLNEYSAKTHAEDVKAWLALAHPDSNEAKRIDFALIPVESSKIRSLALSVMEDQDYAMFSGAFGINSNSAAHAIANHYSDVADPAWRLAIGSGNADKINYGFYVRENGCGNGLYYGKELDSSPSF